MQVEPGQAGWRKFREREDPIKTRKSQKEQPLTAWLAGPSTAWSFESLCSWHFRSPDIFIWWCIDCRKKHTTYIIYYHIKHICVCLCFNMCINMLLCIRILLVSAYVCILLDYTYTYVYLNIYVYKYIYIYICLFKLTYGYIYIYTYVYIYIYMCVCVWVDLVLSPKLFIQRETPQK